MANHLAAGVAHLATRYPDRHNPFRFARHRRDGASSRSRSSNHDLHRPQRPILQIYRATHTDLSLDVRSAPGFQDAAAATIVILLTMLITLNAAAIVLRNYFSARNRTLV